MKSELSSEESMSTPHFMTELRNKFIFTSQPVRHILEKSPLKDEAYAMDNGVISVVDIGGYRSIFLTGTEPTVNNGLHIPITSLQDAKVIAAQIMPDIVSQYIKSDTPIPHSKNMAKVEHGFLFTDGQNTESAVHQMTSVTFPSQSSAIDACKITRDCTVSGGERLGVYVSPRDPDFVTKNFWIQRTGEDPFILAAHPDKIVILQDEYIVCGEISYADLAKAGIPMQRSDSPDSLNVAFQLADGVVQIKLGKHLIPNYVTQLLSPTALPITTSSVTIEAGK